MSAGFGAVDDALPGAVGLAATGAMVFPYGLDGVLRRLLAGERLDAPVELPWVGRSRA